MTHWPFIAGAYAATLGVAAYLAVSVMVRLGRAKRQLAAVDGRPRTGARS